MKFLLLICMYVPLTVFSQQDSSNGINWTKSLTWAQVKQKAKSQNKYIFVDCYATWCGPCKLMERDVYSDAKIGEVVNSKCISVKVQMDKTNQDNEEIRRWYDDARRLQESFKVNAFPTYLFFSPDGQVVHSAYGFKKKEDFVSLIKDALDSTKQYYRLLENYRQGKKDYLGMPALATLISEHGNKQLADSVARDYKANYLDKIDNASILTKENLNFLARFNFLVNSHDRFFDFFQAMPAKVDSIVGRLKFSDYFNITIIKREELEERIWKNGRPVTKNPNWQRFFQEIARKYDSSIAKEVLSYYKEPFYLRTGNWIKWAEIQEEKIKKAISSSDDKALSPFGNATALNQLAWSVFQNCNDKTVLVKALGWSDLSIRMDQTSANRISFFDTRANLLYKLGRVKEAIKQEEIAVKLDEEKKTQNGEANQSSEFEITLSKMRNGKPTWNEKN